MCGIYFSTHPKRREENPLSKMAHRGPDSQNYYSTPKGTLGHVRLSIVDLSEAGNQPFFNHNRSLALVCNGEIYNSPELRRILEQRGYQFKSKSDNEVILYGYEEWGVEIVSKLIGMFAFIIWEVGKDKVFIARDHVGIKPVYYSNSRDHLCAASELSVLKSSRSMEDINPLSIAYLLFLGYIPSPYSLLKEYSKLEPGCFMLWEKGKGSKIQRYWSPPDHSLQTDSNPQKSFNELFEEVLSDHLLSDVPIGAFLSGGLDSTSIVVGLKKLGYEASTLTIGFPSSIKDESKIAKKTAQFLNFNSMIKNRRDHDVIEWVDKVVAVYDEPQGYSALMTMLDVCELAAADYKVILSGDGGDEVFGGYTWYNDIGLNYSSQKRRTLFKHLYRCFPIKPFHKPELFNTSSDLHRHSRRLYPRFLPEEIEQLLQPFEVRFPDELALEPLKKWFEPNMPLKRALQRVDLMTFCADSINPKVDRASMAYSLEVRVPFLDKRMIDFGLSLPISDAVDLLPKQLLRTYLKGKVPTEVLEQPKQGFSSQGFSEQAKASMNDYLQVNAPPFKVNLNNLRFDQKWVMYSLTKYLNP